jgi:hypothetical protein
MHRLVPGGIVVARSVDLPEKRAKGGTIMAASENVRAKSLDSPDETRTFDHGKLDIANID